MDMREKKQPGAKESTTCEEGRPRYHPPAYAPDRLALVALEAAIGTLSFWTCQPIEIRSALDIPSCRCLARWRCGKESVPGSTRERVAVVSALRNRMIEVVDLVTLKPLAEPELPDCHEVPGRSLRASQLIDELLTLLKLLGLEDQEAQGRKGHHEQSSE
ncbi:hypothetical protein [Pelagibius sp. 7325]|uniref:hypothetical protein n=1 Tax=Pelagibius sp. 7325 TaxID=3131994 RepID=UPI0030ED2F2A